jgi:hypothetical protein
MCVKRGRFYSHEPHKPYESQERSFDHIPGNFFRESGTLNSHRDERWLRAPFFEAKICRLLIAHHTVFVDGNGVPSKYYKKMHKQQLFLSLLFRLKVTT